MKKFFGFRKKKEPPPSPSRSGGGGEEPLRSKERGKLHRAAGGGDLKKLQQLVQKKKHDLNQLDEANRTPLHLACASGCTDVVTFLVDNKCRLNLCDNDNRSPLMTAVQYQQEFCAIYLLQHGADPNVVDLNNNTALHLAVANSSISIAEQLLEYNANIDAQNKDGNTPLILAIADGNQEMAEFLLKKGASVHAKENAGRTPLMTAASNGDYALIHVLVEHGADVSEKDTNGWTAEDYALISGYPEVSKKLIGYGSEKYAEKPSSDSRKGTSVFSSPVKDGDADFTLGAPATNKEEMQQALYQMATNSGKVVDDVSGDSSRDSRKTDDDSWLSSEDDLDFNLKKPQKPNLAQLVNVSQQFRKNNDENEIENNQLAKKKAGAQSPNQQEIKDPNDSCGSSEEENGEYVDEGDEIEEEGDEDEEEFEEEDEEEEEIEDNFSQEKEDENIEDNHGKLENEDGFEKSGKRKLSETFADYEHAQEQTNGNRNIPSSSNEMCNVQNGEIQELTDVLESFIAGHFECPDENKPINEVSNELPSHSLDEENSSKFQGKNVNNCEDEEKNANFQNSNEFQISEENEEILDMSQQGFHIEACLSETFEEATSAKSAFSFLLNKGRNSNLGDTFESDDDDPVSEAELERHRSRKQNSENTNIVEYQNIEEQYSDLQELKLVYEPLVHKWEQYVEENLKGDFQSNIIEESSEEDDGEDGDEEDREVSLLDRNKTCYSNSQNPLQDGSLRKDLSTLGMDKEVDNKDTKSPWDSECTSESPRKTTKFSARDTEYIHGVSEESHGGRLSNSQESEGTETRELQKSNLMEELGLDEAGDIEDESDWDSTSISLKSVPCSKPLNGQSDAATKTLEIIPVGIELSDDHMVIPLKGGQSTKQKDLIEIENDWNKVEEEKRKQKWEELEAAGKSENAATAKKFTVNTVEHKIEQKRTVKENQYIKLEGEVSEESKAKNIVSSVERRELIPIPVKGNHIVNTKDVRKRQSKRWISKQKTSQPISENLHPLQEDSSLSETSVEETSGLEGISARTGNGKNKVPRRVGSINDSGDLTQSSDTAAEDIDLPSSVYREAVMLIEQFSLDNKADSISLLKIQNVVHGYERLIEYERGRCAQLLGRVKKIKNEKKELQRILEGMREMKSLLDHEKVQWESDISSLKFSLKQEEEKRMSAEMLYEKNQERLRKKEEQYCKEMEEKQQLELRLRSLELELRNLKNHMKEVEEHHNETQRRLTQEQNARVLQEGILNTHLWRQKELEEESKRALAKSSEVADSHDQEMDLLQKNQILQDELALLRSELDQIRVQHQEQEAKYVEENEALKEKAEELKKELKLNEEALTQTVFQYSGQINVIKTESALLTSKLEHIKEDKERLEVELDSCRSRLSSATQELERTSMSKNDLERTLQQERDELLRLKDKLTHDLSNLQQTNNNMSQLLSKTESKANSLENELHHVTHTLREKNLLIESIQRDLSQAQCQVKELENAQQMEKEQMNKYVIKQESMQVRLAQLQSENLLLQQQLENFQNQGIIKEKVVSDVQDRFDGIFTTLRADTEKQVQMVEERNKELITKCNHLRDQVFKYEMEKGEREGALRQLQQELKDSLKKQSMSEASLDVTTRYRNNLEEDKQLLQKEIDRIKSKLLESEEQYIHSERRIQDLRNALDAKGSEANVLSQKLQDLLVSSSGANNAIKQLEEHIQRLEIENARLEATNKQQTSRIDILQKDLQDSTAVHSRLEELITGLQTTKINLEEQLNHQVQKETMLSVTAQDAHNMWEEELKSRSKLGIRLSELDREKTKLMAHLNNEKKKVKKLTELKQSVEFQLGQEMKRNNELQKECNRTKKLLKTTKKKLKEYESGENSSQNILQGEMNIRYSETDIEAEKLKTKIEELSHQLGAESTKCTQLEATNQDLQDQLSSVKILHTNYEKLEKSKLQLEDEVANLKRHVQGNMIDCNQIEQYKKEIEERTRQQIRQKLEEVNLFLQTQAASQETLEQIRAANNASLKNQLEQRIGDLESELARLKTSQQDNVFLKESARTELERYKGLYLEELKMRKSLGSKLDRANEKLSEANAKLLHERQRTRCLLASSSLGGSLLASPVLETVQFGNLSSNLALNRTSSLGGGFMNPSGNALCSKTRVEAYLEKMQMELEKNITRELDQAAAELAAGSVRVSPVGSIDGSSKNLNTEQDQVSKATQKYLDVLKKNYMK